MQHQEFEPPIALKDIVKCFWYNKKDYGETQSGFEVVPDGYAEIIFHFGNGCSISVDGDLQALPSPFMIGLLNEPVTFYSKNYLEIIGIRCFPWTIFKLLDLPPGKEGVRIFEHPISQLQSQLEKCVYTGRIDDALTCAMQYLLEASSSISTNNMLSKAGTLMREANGTIPVSKVAGETHVTIRTLERNFKQTTGHTVKDVSALIRFEQVRNHLMLNPNASLAGLAHELGYADQPHLSREFKRYSGTSPAAFIRKTTKGLQAKEDDFVAFIQA